jgi:hypothetical protein
MWDKLYQKWDELYPVWVELYQKWGTISKMGRIISEMGNYIKDGMKNSFICASIWWESAYFGASKLEFVESSHF